MNEAALALKEKVATAVVRTVKRKDVDAHYSAAHPISEAVTEAIGADILNATNNEPWYQSKVLIGSAMALVTAGYSLVLDFTDGTLPTPESLATQLGAIIGSAIAIYGRLSAIKRILK